MKSNEHKAQSKKDRLNQDAMKSTYRDSDDDDNERDLGLQCKKSDLAGKFAKVVDSD